LTLCGRSNGEADFLASPRAFPEPEMLMNMNVNTIIDRIGNPFVFVLLSGLD
jgi:hypothetical protein